MAQFNESEQVMFNPDTANLDAAFAADFAEALGGTNSNATTANAPDLDRERRRSDFSYDRPAKSKVEPVELHLPVARPPLAPGMSATASIMPHYEDGHAAVTLPVKAPQFRRTSPAPTERFRPKGKLGQPALLEEADIARILAWLEANNSTPAAARAIVLLTVRAGLRPSEVAGLQTRTLVTATGDLLDYVRVMPGTAKRGKERSIPMHPQLSEALRRFFREHPGAERVALHRIGKGPIRYHSVHSVTQWFRRIYAAIGLVGCSSTSGRHTFATGLSRLCIPPIEIQTLLGHANLSTTRIYMRPTGVSKDLISQLGGATYGAIVNAR